MGLQALLFCSDDRILRVLRRVLSDMEIHVDQCSDADSAIHKLTRRRYEAVIVDCSDQEVSAQVLSSLRTAPTNRRAVAVAIIDREKAVKSAFDIGAHFVLYQPISMERAKTAFRAARALMKRERRRNERVPLEMSVVLLSSIERREVLTADLGEGGMAVQTGRLSTTSEPLRIQFTLPGTEFRIECAGEVAWENGNRQVGLRFMDMSSEHQSLLRAWLERYAPQDMVSDDPPLSCKLSGLSPAACYLETETPFPVRASVTLFTAISGTRLQVSAIVRVMHPDMGMGLEFIHSTDDEKHQAESFVQALQEHEHIGSEILVEPEGLEGNAPPSTTMTGKDPLLDMFRSRKDLPAQAFQEELRKRREATGSSAKAAVFSV